MPHERPYQEMFASYLFILQIQKPVINFLPQPPFSPA